MFHTLQNVPTVSEGNESTTKEEEEEEEKKRIKKKKNINTKKSKWVWGQSQK